MRGMIALSIEVSGPARDLHSCVRLRPRSAEAGRALETDRPTDRPTDRSPITDRCPNEIRSGNEGGVFSEPLADLSKVLASLVDGRSAILVPGFCDGARPGMLEAAMARLDGAAGAAEFSLDGYRAALGVARLSAGLTERELLEQRWCAPSLSVVDVRVGTAADAADSAHYRFGPTRFSVIPRAAVGQVSIRFVPDQDAAALVAALEAHVRHEFAKLRSGNRVELRVHSVGDWWEADPGSALMRLAEDAVAAEWGERPLLVREGGTMPVASTLEKMLGAPALLVPMGQASDNCHLANERIRRLNLMRGKNVVKNILVAMGGAAAPAATPVAAPAP
jgi:di- and tripeptidase/Cys-Gly metallodipeptidase DUG1